MTRDARYFGCLLLAALLAVAFCPSISFADEEASEEAAATASEESQDEDTEASHDGDDHDGAGHHGSEDHDHAHEGEHGGNPDPLLFDPDLAIWNLGVFLLMLAILSQVAWKPIMEGLKNREDNIAGNLAAADAKHEEAKALLADHQAKLAGAADEVRALLEEARRDADATIAQAKADAKAAADTERERAVRDIEQAKDAAVRQLAERSAGLAIDLAAKVVRQDITAERQSEIVRDALGRFSDGGPSAN